MARDARRWVAIDQPNDHAAEHVLDEGHVGAMAHDARLLLIEQVIPPGNEPSLSKLYDLHMLVLSGGRERREDEYRDLLAVSDLQLERIIPTEVPRSVIEALPR